uniref:Aspartate dehydrogenase domain-containing protein n=1 Tax=Anisakis simplex TaxID=6269 RepID=A0A0M3K393_ANISI
LKEQLDKDERFKVTKIWNRSNESADPSILPLIDLDIENLSCVDMVIEVAHPSIVTNFGVLILKYADFFVGSSTALADAALYETLKHAVQVNKRRLFIPSGSFWGADDIQKMANLGTIKGLTITMIKHPSSLRLEGPLQELNEKAKLSDSAVVLYDGSLCLQKLHRYATESFPISVCKLVHNWDISTVSVLLEIKSILFSWPVRALCSLAPNNVNVMASASIAAHTLGFDLVRAKLISDPSLSSWHIVEIDVEGPDGFRVRTRRENPAKPGALAGSLTHQAFLSCVQSESDWPVPLASFTSCFHYVHHNSSHSKKHLYIAV